MCSTTDDGTEYVLYVDPWFENPHCPDSYKLSVPTDADYVLVTHGHYDHINSAPDLIKASTKPGAKLISTPEIHAFFNTVHGIPEDKLHRMNKSGTLFLPFG